MNAKFALITLVLLAGCKHPSITAVPLSAWNRDEPCGIPFYLPKPLLVIAKNFRNVEEAKVGLTDSAPIPNYFDDQAKFGDINARTSWVPHNMTSTGGSVSGTSPANTFPSASNSPLASTSPPRTFAGGAPISPGAAPQDGLTPETFFTYQIIFVPDLTQKYGLQIKGGVGEIRAAMNLVNGWMFTGLGPYYMKDSSTAQNVLATGIAANLASSGVSDVVQSVAGLAKAAGGPASGQIDATVVQETLRRVESFGERKPVDLHNFAEIYIYEPYLTCDGKMEWRPVAEHHFVRQFLGTAQNQIDRELKRPASAPLPPPTTPPGGPASGQLSSGVPASGCGSNVNQINFVDNCNPPCQPPSWWDKCKSCFIKQRPRTVQIGSEADSLEELRAAQRVAVSNVPPPGGGAPVNPLPLVPVSPGSPGQK